MKAHSSVAAFFLFLPAANAKIADYRETKLQSPKKVWIDANFYARKVKKKYSLNVPSTCLRKNKLPKKVCQGNHSYDRRLEQYYWHIIETRDSIAMASWLKIVSSYLFNTPKNPNRGRLKMLSIFGNLHAYSLKPKVFNIMKSPHIMGAYAAGRETIRLLPRSPNAQVFPLAVNNFTQFALGLKSRGLDSANKMLEFESMYQDEGLAGPVGAVAHLMGHADKKVVAYGIKSYDACYQRGLCAKQTSIAPFQVIGSLITQAEALGYLGDIKAMHQKLDEVESLAQTRKWPFIGEIPEIRKDLIMPGGLLDQWQDRNQKNGIRVPLGAGHRTTACSYCHVGNHIPKWYHIPHQQI